MVYMHRRMYIIYGEMNIDVQIACTFCTYIVACMYGMIADRMCAKLYMGASAGERGAGAGHGESELSVRYDRQFAFK